MTTKKKPAKHEESDAAPTPPSSPFAAHGGSPVVSEPAKPIGWVKEHAHAAAAACPTCGTAKTENRCAVCGHQEHDT